MAGHPAEDPDLGALAVLSAEGFPTSAGGLSCPRGVQPHPSAHRCEAKAREGCRRGGVGLAQGRNRSQRRGLHRGRRGLAVRGASHQPQSHGRLRPACFGVHRNELQPLGQVETPVVRHGLRDAVTA